MRIEKLFMIKRIILVLWMGFSYLLASNLIIPLPQKVDFDKQKALLGKKLFFDPILSKDNTISCATCHNLQLGGVDNLVHSFGINAQEGDINTPTVLNSFFNFRQMWNGKAKTLHAQAVFPIENPIEMGNTFENIIVQLNAHQEYKEAFEENYKEGVTKENILDALEQFQKTLITQSPFDDYLRGDENAITQDQKKGFELFKRKGCISCHNGVNIGGASFSRLGVVNSLAVEQTGLYEVTGNELDRFFFKVPSLRNVELTYPYFHTGEISELKEAIKVIAKIQLGLDLQEDEIALIEEFLKSLTGKVEIIE